MKNVFIIVILMYVVLSVVAFYFGSFDVTIFCLIISNIWAVGAILYNKND